MWGKYIGAYILTKPTDVTAEKTPEKQTELVDYFVTKDGETFAGFHLLVEVWDGKHLTEPKYIDDVLCRAAKAAQATILHSHMHHFLPSGGVSGVVLLAESHISIHTWPERDYAAIDIFMCGSCDPHLAVSVLKDGFEASNIEVKELRRGLVANSASNSALGS